MKWVLFLSILQKYAPKKPPSLSQTRNSGYRLRNSQCSAKVKKFITKCSSWSTMAVTVYKVHYFLSLSIFRLWQLHKLNVINNSCSRYISVAHCLKHCFCNVMSVDSTNYGLILSLWLHTNSWTHFIHPSRSPCVNIPDQIHTRYILMEN